MLTVDCCGLSCHRDALWQIFFWHQPETKLGKVTCSSTLAQVWSFIQEQEIWNITLSMDSPPSTQLLPSVNLQKTTAQQFILIISQFPWRELIEINYFCMNQMDKEEKREYTRKKCEICSVTINWRVVKCDHFYSTSFRDWLLFAVRISVKILALPKRGGWTIPRLFVDSQAILKW